MLDKVQNVFQKKTFCNGEEPTTKEAGKSSLKQLHSRLSLQAGTIHQYEYYHTGPYQEYYQFIRFNHHVSGQEKLTGNWMSPDFKNNNAMQGALSTPFR